MCLTKSQLEQTNLNDLRGSIPQGMSCTNCQTTKTPLWRRSDKGELLCNACGLYAKSRNGPRPVTKRSETFQVTESKKDACLGTCPGDGHCNGTGGSSACSGCPAFNQRSRPAQYGDTNMICSNCSSTTTPLWRRDDKGAVICNACGLYFKMHGSHRPVTMRKTTIKRRNRALNRGPNHNFITDEVPGSPAASNLDNNNHMDSTVDSSTGCCSHEDCPATPEDIENCQPNRPGPILLPKITVALTDGPLEPSLSHHHQLSHIINPPGSPTAFNLSPATDRTYPSLPPLISSNSHYQTPPVLPPISSLTCFSRSNSSYSSHITSPELTSRLSDSDDKFWSSSYCTNPSPSYQQYPLSDLTHPHPHFKFQF